MIGNRIGNRIRKFREKKGLSQRQLAERLETTQQQIQRYEMGGSAIRLDVALGLAEVLQVEVDRLFPDIKAPLAKLRKRENTPDRSAVEEALRAGGVEADPTVWTLMLTLRGGLKRKYCIPSFDRLRLERVLAPDSEKGHPSPFFWFQSPDYSVTLNLEHVLACHLLFDPPYPRTELEDKNLGIEDRRNVRVWLASAAEPLTFNVDIYDDRDEVGMTPFESNFLVSLDEFGYDLGFVSFADEDDETVYVRPQDIVLVEADLEVLHSNIDHDDEPDEQKN